ncbi:MAG TPA: membrane protein insertase YidC [Myxococcaceae bacterium]|nr:membrane protein insertase YidC [Myxococcaceae bacterium]
METDTQQKRLMVALIASFALTAVYMLFNQGGLRPSPAPVDAGAPAPVAVEKPVPHVETPAAAPVPPAAAAPSTPEPPRLLVEVDRPRVRYRFSSEGAGLVSALLEGPRMREVRRLSIPEGFALLFGKQVPPAPQMNLAEPVAGAPLPLAVEVAGSSPVSPSLPYQVTAQGPLSLTFVGRTGAWEVTKRVVWSQEGLELNVAVTLRNVSGQLLAGELGIHQSRAIDPAHEEKPSLFGGVGNLSDAACLVKDSLEKLSPSDKLETKDHPGAVSWFGVNQQYFLSAIFVVGGAREGRCVVVASPTARAASAWFPVQVAPGESVTQVFGVYLGPKENELLASVPTLPENRASASWSPRLERAVDFGIWAVICKLMLVVLRFFHGLIGNWGVAIVLLTVVVKVLLVPLTHRMMVSQEAMKKLQPQLEALKTKYPDDREKQQREMMRVYQEAGVNPFGSCLMLLVQLPIWAALFTTLRNSFELYGEPFVQNFLPDLTFKDPTYLLPLLLGVSQIITGLLQPMALDAAQQRIMVWFMPIFFTVIMLNYPAGLLLYIFTNNVLTVAQTYVLRRWLQRRTPPAQPVAAGVPPRRPAVEKRK